MKKHQLQYIKYFAIYLVFFILGVFITKQLYTNSLSHKVLGAIDKEKSDTQLEISFEKDSKKNIFSFRNEYFIQVNANKEIFIPAFYENLTLENVGGQEFLLNFDNLRFGDNEFSIPLLDREGNTIYYRPNIYRNRYQMVDENLYKWIDADYILSIVDKNFFVDSSYNPKDLVYIYKYDIPQAYKGMMLREEAAVNLSQLISDSKEEDLILIVLSAYRSYDKQKDTYNYWLRYAGKEEAENRVAKPGHSEHQLGTAVDFTTYYPDYEASKEFDKTEEGEWLAKNAYKYGFVLTYPKGKEKLTGYQFEPWHFRYVGKSHAKEIKKRGVLPITYLKEMSYINQHEQKDTN